MCSSISIGSLKRGEEDNIFEGGKEEEEKEG